MYSHLSLGPQYFIYFDLMLSFSSIDPNDTCFSVVYFAPHYGNDTNIIIGTPALFYCPEGLLYFTNDGSIDNNDDGGMLNKTFLADIWYKVSISQLLDNAQVSNQHLANFIDHTALSHWEGENISK